MTTLRFLGIPGRLRAGSYNTAALRAAMELAPDGVAVELASIKGIPAYNEDARAEGRPAEVTALQGRIAAADAVIVATPEYNYSVPDVLKNALDWLSKSEPQPFLDKPVGIIGASPGAIGTARAQYDLRKMFVYLDAHVLNKPEVMIGAAHTRFDSSGRLTDDATRDFLKAMVVALRDWTLRLPPPS